MSLFNGASEEEHNDYQLYVITNLPQLQHLDDTAITEAHRVQAKSYRYLCGLSGTVNFFDRISIYNRKSVKKRTDENDEILNVMKKKMDTVCLSSD